MKRIFYTLIKLLTSIFDLYSMHKSNLCKNIIKFTNEILTLISRFINNNKDFMKKINLLILSFLIIIFSNLHSMDNHQNQNIENLRIEVTNFIKKVKIFHINLKNENLIRNHIIEEYYQIKDLYNQLKHIAQISGHQKIAHNLARNTFHILSEIEKLLESYQ